MCSKNSFQETKRDWGKVKKKLLWSGMSWWLWVKVPTMNRLLALVLCHSSFLSPHFLAALLTVKGIKLSESLKKYQKGILIKAITRKPALHLSGCILYVLSPHFNKKDDLISTRQAGWNWWSITYMTLTDWWRGPVRPRWSVRIHLYFPPVSIKSSVSHSEISCLLSQTLWRGVKPFSAPPDTEATYQTSSFLLVCICGCSHLPMCGFSVCPPC